MLGSMQRATLLLGSLLGLLPPSCGPGDDECTPDMSYAPEIDPANFVAGVTHPLFPLVPGTEYTYMGPGEMIKVAVTSDTRMILGIPCVVVKDTAYVGNEIVEDTLDWFAQDKDGNVWYMGEDTKEYEGGKVVSTEGSWEAGVDGAQPGIVMHAVQPALRQPYRQEYYACEAEDMAEVTALAKAISVPFGDYTDCLETHEFTPLEADLDETKYFCPGVGLTLEVDNATGSRTELVGLTIP